MNQSINQYIDWLINKLINQSIYYLYVILYLTTESIKCKKKTSRDLLSYKAEAYRDNIFHILEKL